MPDPSRLADSTQIVLPCETLEGFRSHLEERFTISVYTDASDEVTRIIGSPVEIKAVSDYLSRQGVSIQ